MGSIDTNGLDVARDDVLVGIVDGMPDIHCPGLAGASLMIEHLVAPPFKGGFDRHGTEITNLILGASSVRPGIARGATGLILPVFSEISPETGTRVASQVDVARALGIAALRGAAIVNVSAGQKASTVEAGHHLEQSLALCEDRRVLVLAAAGNDGCACLHVPAAVATVLAVGATDVNGLPLELSNWGAAYGRHGLLAPGQDVETVGAEDRIVRRTGTSYATAIVSAVAARLLATARNAGYAIAPTDIRSILIESADPCDAAAYGDCQRFLSGRLNVQAALQLLHETGRGTPSPPRSVMPSGDPTHDAIPEGHVSQKRMEDLMTQADHAGAAVENATALEQSDSPSPTSDTALVPAVAAAPLVDTVPVVAAAPAVETSEAPLVQSACACGGGGTPPQLVYTIGSLWFDFGTEARYDAIVQAMGDTVAANTPSRLFAFLSENLEYATGITFILMQDQVPVYAIQPIGPFAERIYQQMLGAMAAAIEEGGELQRVSIPGIAKGTTRLMNGMVLTVIYPDLRGLVQWKPMDIVSSAKAAAGTKSLEDETILNFLVRVYDSLRNFGMSPEDRAINYSATNAYQVARVLQDGISRRLELYGIDVRKSPICRPDSDCWDVQLKLFDPENERRAARFYRFTVDVSETLPVTVGPVRTWSAPVGAGW